MKNLLLYHLPAMKWASVFIGRCKILLAAGPICFSVASLMPGILYCNNIAISSVTLVNQNTSTNTITIQFDCTWDNSWYESANIRDAAWIFVKYKVPGSNWTHANLLASDAEHIAPAGGEIKVGFNPPSSGVGVFLYRNQPGSGTFTQNGVQLKWNYGAVDFNQTVELKVFAIEMVYVPEGSFSLGDGASASASRFSLGSSQNSAYTITASTINLINAITAASTNLYVPGLDINPSSLPVAFPTGFNAFYAMKYEISQQGYVDFLNTLTRTQQAARVASVTVNQFSMSATVSPQSRNGIRHSDNGASLPYYFYCDLNNNGLEGDLADGQWIACNYLSFLDLAAYLDWCGLRPMSELEYEKSCRGINPPIPNQYPWGNTGIVNAASIINAGTINEICGTTGANAVCTNNANVPGPMRVGVFARATTTRAQAGGGYYGQLDMGGNLTEQAVTVANSTGRAFNGGNHGNGALTAAGGADVISWPGSSGAGQRGGSFSDITDKLRISDRSSASIISNTRSNMVGGRGVRKAP